MRVTRARAQQSAEEPAATEPERSPLLEISPNASPEQPMPVEEEPINTTKGKGKKGAKKGGKGKKVKAQAEEEPVLASAEDEPAEAIAEEQLEEANIVEKDLTKDVQGDQISENDERPASPVPRATRLTRRQLAKQEELKQTTQKTVDTTEPEAKEVKTDLATAEEKQNQEIDTNLDLHPEGEEVAEQVKDSQRLVAEDHNPDESVALEPSKVEVPVTTIECESEEAALVPEDDVSVQKASETKPEPKSLVAEQPTEDALSPAASRTPSRRRASRSPSKSPMRIEESIEALDALEEALEDVGKAVSHFDQLREEKSPRKMAFPRDVATPNARSKGTEKTPLTQRVSKTPSAAPLSAKPTKSSLARASSVRVASSKSLVPSNRKGSTETHDYLASKRRPISVSFPTPPPPPKGRAPTKPAFQLSSDGVAAKLKAQKEERLKREAERTAEGVASKQRPVSISLAPTIKSSKPPTKANFQLPGEAIAAKLKAQREERLQREGQNSGEDQPKLKARPISMPPLAVKSTKAPTKANFQLPGEAIAAKLKAQREERQKREEEAEAAKKAAAAMRPRPTAVRKPIALPSRPQPGVTIPPPPKAEPSGAFNKRNSLQLSRSGSVSTTNSTSNPHASKSTVTAVDAAQQKLKGREVFLRDKMEKDLREQERREKEEAAKKARAEAAERGRIASREWAERQRKKMMDAVKGKIGAA